MARRATYIKPLLLAGGRAARTGSPKHLLPMPDGRPLYLRLIDLLRGICPESPKVYLSLPGDSRLEIPYTPPDVETICDGGTDGPAACLLAAHRADPEATWVVAACDFPLLTAATLERLRQAYTPPVTCFRSSAGLCEPLVGVWSPEALGKLADHEGAASPSGVVRQLGGLTLGPPDGCDSWLWDVDTKEDWQVALQRLGSPHRMSLVGGI